MEEAVADLTGGGERRLPGDPCLYLILRLNWSAQEQQKPISRWDPTSFHIKIWIRLPLLIFLLNLPASSPRNEPWENARAQPARSFARGKFLQRSWLATPPNGEPACWLLLTLLSLKRTLSVKCSFPHYLSPIPRGIVFKKKQKQKIIPFMQGADNKTYNKKYRQHSSHGETSDFQLWKQYYQVLFI